MSSGYSSPLAAEPHRQQHHHQLSPLPISTASSSSASTPRQQHHHHQHHQQEPLSTEFHVLFGPTPSSSGGDSSADAGGGGNLSLPQMTTGLSTSLSHGLTSTGMNRREKGANGSSTGRESASSSSRPYSASPAASSTWPARGGAAEQMTVHQQLHHEHQLHHEQQLYHEEVSSSDRRLSDEQQQRVESAAGPNSDDRTSNRSERHHQKLAYPTLSPTSTHYHQDPNAGFHLAHFPQMHQNQHYTPPPPQHSTPPTAIPSGYPGSLPIAPGTLGRHSYPGEAMDRPQLPDPGISLHHAPLYHHHAAPGVGQPPSAPPPHLRRAQSTSAVGGAAAPGASYGMYAPYPTSETLPPIPIGYPESPLPPAAQAAAAGPPDGHHQSSSPLQSSAASYHQPPADQHYPSQQPYEQGVVVIGGHTYYSQPPPPMHVPGSFGEQLPLAPPLYSQQHHPILSLPPPPTTSAQQQSLYAQHYHQHHHPYHHQLPQQHVSQPTSAPPQPLLPVTTEYRDFFTGLPLADQPPPAAHYIYETVPPYPPIPRRLTDDDLGPPGSSNGSGTGGWSDHNPHQLYPQDQERSQQPSKGSSDPRPLRSRSASEVNGEDESSSASGASSPESSCFVSPANGEEDPVPVTAPKRPARPPRMNSSASTPKRARSSPLSSSASTTTAKKTDGSKTASFSAGGGSNRRTKRVLHPSRPLATCGTCSRPLAHLLLRGEPGVPLAEWEGVWRCLICVAGGGPDAGVAGTNTASTGGKKGSETAGGSASAEPVVRRKRNRETQDLKAAMVCDVCLKAKGEGGIVPVDPRGTINFTVEYVCISCEETYSRCTDCGGGGGGRIGIGKWRCKELFQNGRRTCSLSHTRLGSSPLELGVWDIAEIQADPAVAAEMVARCSQAWRERVLARMAIPEVLEGPASNTFGSFQGIKEMLDRGWPSAQTVLAPRHPDDMHTPRRFLGLTWARTKMRRGPAKQEEPDALDGEIVAGATGELANMRRTNVIIPPGRDLVGLWLGDWSMLNGTLLISTSLPFEGMDGDDRSVLTIGEMACRIVEEIDRINAAHPERPPLPLLEHLWVVSDGASLSVRDKMYDVLARRRQFLPLDEYLIRHPTVDPAIFSDWTGPSDTSGSGAPGTILVRWLGQHFDRQRLEEMAANDLGKKNVGRRPRKR